MSRWDSGVGEPEVDYRDLEVDPPEGERMVELRVPWRVVRRLLVASTDLGAAVSAIEAVRREVSAVEEELGDAMWGRPEEGGE